MSDKVTIEIPLEEAARRYASENSCYFVKCDLMEELLAIPSVNRLMVYNPRKLMYVRSISDRSV